MPTTPGRHLRRGLRIVATLVATLAIVVGSPVFAGGKGSGGSVYVKPHVTKSGTCVEGHYRSAPNATRADNYSTSGNVNPYTGKAGTADPLDVPAAVPPNYTVTPGPRSTTQAVPGYSLGGAPARDPITSRIERSQIARRDFQRTAPCPSTGLRSGACPGYEIDHATPLKCGGADAPANMQWLSVEVHAMKTAREASSCVSR